MRFQEAGVSFTLFFCGLCGGLRANALAEKTKEMGFLGRIS